MTLSLQQGLQAVVSGITTRLERLEAASRTEVTGGVSSTTLVGAGLPGQRGRLRFISNGRKVGEGAGAGTGVLAYDDSSAWRRSSDDTTVVT